MIQLATPGAFPASTARMSRISPLHRPTPYWGGYPTFLSGISVHSRRDPSYERWPECTKPRLIRQCCAPVTILCPSQNGRSHCKLAAGIPTAVLAAGPRSGLDRHVCTGVPYSPRDGRDRQAGVLPQLRQLIVAVPCGERTGERTSVPHPAQETTQWPSTPPFVHGWHPSWLASRMVGVLTYL